MKKSFYLYAIFMIFLISVCIVQTVHSEPYNDILQTWMGSHIDKLVDKWGYPQRSFEAPNGNTVYVYHSEADSRLIYKTDKYIIPLPKKYCTTYMEVDNRGIIVKGRWEGNSCE